MCERLPGTIRSLHTMTFARGDREIGKGLW